MANRTKQAAKRTLRRRKKTPLHGAKGDKALQTLYQELETLYEQTKKQARELEKANKVKSEFLSVMSHELRTPLNMVMVYTGMIHDGILGGVNPEQKEALGKIQRYSNDLLTVITAIMNVVTLEAGAVKVESGEVNLGSFLEELRTLYSVPLDKEINLVWDYPFDLPVVRTDSAKLRHILQNLINNATKFTDKGDVTISVRYFPKAKSVEFKVADSGIGIPEDTLPLIFEMFHQLDSSETRAYGGVGIGLYIVKTFTEMLSGKVKVESESGKGSTFTVAIPYAIQ